MRSLVWVDVSVGMTAVGPPDRSQSFAARKARQVTVKPCGDESNRVQAPRENWKFTTHSLFILSGF